MHQPPVVEVARDKSSEVVSIGIVLGFLALGGWFLTQSTAQLEHISRTAAMPMVRAMAGHPGFTRALTVAELLACAFGLVLFAKKYRDPTPALVLDAQGLTDRHYDPAEALGPIDWAEIADIQLKRAVEPDRSGKDVLRKTLVVKLRDPVRHLGTGTQNRRRISLDNIKTHGSPVAIPEKAMVGDIDDIFARASAAFRAYAAPPTNDPQGNPAP